MLNELPNGFVTYERANTHTIPDDSRRSWHFDRTFSSSKRQQLIMHELTIAKTLFRFTSRRWSSLYKHDIWSLIKTVLLWVITLRTVANKCHYQQRELNKFSPSNISFNWHFNQLFNLSCELRPFFLLFFISRFGKNDVFHELSSWQNVLHESQWISFAVEMNFTEFISKTEKCCRHIFAWAFSINGISHCESVTSIHFVTYVNFKLHEKSVKVIEKCLVDSWKWNGNPVW